MLRTNPVFRPLLWPTALTILGLAVLIGLGSWQIERLHWKLDLIATINARMAAAPAPAPSQSEWAALDLGKLEYHHLKLEGRYLNDRELHYFAQNDEGAAGYDIITPLVLNDGSIVLVDRGFVPVERKDASTRLQGQIEGDTIVTGVARAPQATGMFTAPDDVPGHIWFTRDPAKMAKALDLSPVAPFYVEADKTPNLGGLPIGGRTQVHIRNQHFEYAMTWFGLALVLFAIYVSYHWSNGRIGRPKD